MNEIQSDDMSVNLRNNKQIRAPGSQIAVEENKECLIRIRS